MIRMLDTSVRPEMWSMTPTAISRRLSPSATAVPSRRRRRTRSAACVVGTMYSRRRVASGRRMNAIANANW
jgi:hypothetical protein